MTLLASPFAVENFDNGGLPADGYGSASNEGGEELYVYVSC